MVTVANVYIYTLLHSLMCFSFRQNYVNLASFSIMHRQMSVLLCIQRPNNGILKLFGGPSLDMVALPLAGGVHSYQPSTLKKA